MKNLTAKFEQALQRWYDKPIRYEPVPVYFTEAEVKEIIKRLKELNIK
jgi:hypothetical protein